MDIRPNLKREYFLIPIEDDSAASMSALARERNPEAKMLLRYPEDRRTKVVKECYPLTYPSR